MQNLFNLVKFDKPKKNLFDLSHDVKLTLDMGQLVPILALECIPGDEHTIGCESLLRFAPLISPVMHRYDVSMHYFFVPNRLVWPNWETYISNQKDENGDRPVFPYITMFADNSNHEIGTLADYLGVPYNLDTMTYTEDIRCNALPFAAYQCVWWEYYRDQNLVYFSPNVKPWMLVDGENLTNLDLQILQRRSWEHDYFTSCLPWAQKGDSVLIPGDIMLKDDVLASGQFQKFVDGSGNPIPGATVKSDGAGFISDGTAEAWVDPNGSLTSGGTINDLRRAFSLQRWLEKAARGGSRYYEWLRIMFGVISDDARLQRPEYITGVKTPVIISENVSTAESANLPQGNMAGQGTAVTGGNYGKYYCKEHGYIIGVMSVMPKTAYMQGFDRSLLKINDPTEFYFSDFANIGEQKVDLNELFAYRSGYGSNDFGYLPRYTEYRFISNRVCANFRTDLDFWHQARIFSSSPQLNAAFVQCSPDKRIFAVTDPQVNSLYCTVLNKIRSMRPIPKYGTPTF